MNLPAPHAGEMAVGARVVAKWPRDNHYYMARLAAKAHSIGK